MLRSLRFLGLKKIVLALWVILSALVIQADSRVIGQELPKVSLMSVDPSSEVVEGTRIEVTLSIDMPVSAGDPVLTGGRLLGGIIVWDTWRGAAADGLVAFAFFPGETTDTISYTVCVADDDGAVQTDRTIRIAVNSVFEEYTVGSRRDTTLRVLDKDAPGVEAPLQGASTPISE